MSITWGERPKRQASTDRKKPTADREYWVSGTLSVSDAVLTIWENSDAVDTDSVVDIDSGIVLPLFRTKISPREEGGGNWTVGVHYEGVQNQYRMKFNIGTQTTKMRQSLEHIATYDCITGGSLLGPGDFDTIPDFKGAIGVTGEGANITVDGADVEIGKVEFTVTKKLEYATLDSGYMSTVANMTPCVNDRPFVLFYRGQVYSFPTGSVLFRGMPTDDDSENVEVNYYFAYSKNVGTTTIPVWVNSLPYPMGYQVSYGGEVWQAIANVSAGVTPVEGVNWTDLGPTGELIIGNSDPIVKEGWQLLWPWYRPKVDNGSIVPMPAAALIERVYNYGNLDLLSL
jgi:hypothetical protein